VDEPPADVEVSYSGGGVAAGVASAIADVMTSVGEPPDVLLAKPANLEQVQIARALARHGAVLVQGPPGTGKSHTIANLIGHLVAQGARVLVTSHTTKALRVLRQHVPEDLRPLCVALLDQDLEGRTQLEEAVRGIVERVGASDEGVLEREVARLTDTRRRLMEAAAALHEQLRVARVAEYEPVVVGGEAIGPVDAARLARDERERHEWLPGPVVPGAPLPLAPEELERLYATNGVLSREEERELEVSLPSRERVLEARTFAEVVAALDVNEPEPMARLWERVPAEMEEIRLTALLEATERLARDLGSMAPWQRALVAAGRQGEGERELWRKLHTQVDDAASGHSRTRDLLLDYAVERVPGAPDDEAEAVIELRQHLASGGGLGWMTRTLRPRWKAALGAWLVNRQAPTRAEHFAAITAWLELEGRRRTLGLRWERQAVPAGLPPLSTLPEPPESALGEYAAQFDGLTGWWDTRWSEVSSLLTVAGFRWAAFRDAEVARAAPLTPFERDVAIASGPLLEVVTARLGVVRRLRAERLLEEQATVLGGHTGVIAVALREALVARDVSAWTQARAALDVVGAKLDAWQARVALLSRLARDARIWADAILNRDGIHGATRAPEDPGQAWRWRQVVQELERRAAVDERAVARELEQRRKELRDVTCTLIDRKAWLAQLRRTDGDARRALIGWSDTQRKLGKRTGKRVPELEARARELLSQARDAVPVWIMPLARVAESFDPRGRTFDVVIVDEASQSDVTGLLAFFLGKRVIVVGDHEQVSPSAVGQKLDDVQHLIAQHLVGIPGAHLYDGQTSIYDLARAAFGGNLALREHFRCVPDIIEFSNHLAYNGQMRPLRDPSTAARPHVAEYVVPAATSTGADGKVNLAEARAAAALLAAMAEMPEYAGQSFGAITLVGDEQALQIQTLLLSLLGADRLQARRFATGNPAQFQGDERDVIVLSMVDRPSLTGRPLALRDTTMFKQRYNVAVSRARDQLWLVHSLEPGRDLQPYDLRRRLIDHVRDPGAVRRAQAAAVRRAESPFEAAVIERLVSAGFRVTPQVEVGRYRIDMVISDGEHRVALECDGDRFHPPEQIPEDIARQAVLERAGWRFIRLRGTRFYRDPEGSMRWVFEELARLGVSPVGQEPEARESGEGLRGAVVRRAWAIMQERGWVAAVGIDAVVGSDAEDGANDAPVIP
jgi:very-short-patch-repair endonuclease